MGYYAVIDGREYLIPGDVIISNENLFARYLQSVGEKKYLDISAIKKDGRYDLLYGFYRHIKYSLETDAINMTELGRYNKVDKSFDPLVAFMKIKTILNKNEQKINEYLESDKIDMAYQKLDESLKYLFELGEKMIENDEFGNNKTK